MARSKESPEADAPRPTPTIVQALDLVRSGDAGASLAVTHSIVGRVGGHEHNPFVVSRRCLVCRSPWLNDIETLAMLGFGYVTIFRSLPEGPEEGAITIDILRRHLERHTSRIRRMILATKAEEAKGMGIDLEDFEGRVFSLRGFLTSVLHSAAEGVVANPAHVSVRDGLTAARIMSDMEKSSADQSNADVFSAMMSAMVIAAQRVMTPAQYASWMGQVESSPQARMVIEARAREREPEIVQSSA